MKKMLACFLAIALLFPCLASCEILPEDLLEKLTGKAKEHTEHTYEYIGNDYTHQKVYTCGCPTPEIAEMHYDNDNDGLCDACGNNHKHIFGEWQYNGTHHWRSGECLWGACDTGTVSMHVDNDSNRYCNECGYKIPTNHFLRNQAGCEWMNEINADDIQKIKIVSEIAGITPGSLKNISVSSDPDVIAELFEEYYRLDTTPIPYEDAMVDGGRAITVNFILNDGSEKQLFFYDGIFCDTYGNSFKPTRIPTIRKETNPQVYNGFITYIDTGTVYTKHRPDGAVIPTGALGEISVGELEFTYDLDIDFPTDFDPDAYGLYVMTEFGKLQFISHTTFIFNEAYCVLVGKDIEELIYTDGVKSLIDVHEAKYNDGRNAFVEMYYGEYPSGAVVGMIVDDKTAYTEALWDETVGGYCFEYYYGNRIVVLYEGEFYTLGEAYENGCLTKSDIALIWSIHNY